MAGATQHSTAELCSGSFVAAGILAGCVVGPGRGGGWVATLP